jgi:hypothetical protein
MTTSDECISHPKIFKGRRHEQLSTKLIWFKVTLEVNVLRVKMSLNQEYRGSGIWLDVMDVKTWSKKLGGEELCLITKFSGFGGVLITPRIYDLLN